MSEIYCEENKNIEQPNNYVSKDDVENDIEKDTEKFNSLVQSMPCTQCNKKSKYRCPKCKIPYCSLDCYRIHSSGIGIHSSAKCSESFYEEQVNIHLKGKKAPKEDKKKMKNLMEEHRNNFEDCEETTFAIENEDQMINHQRAEKLMEKIEQGNLNINDLDPIEQHKFLKFIKDSKNQDKIVKEWQPWWQNVMGIRDLSGNVIDIEIDETAKDEPEKTNSQEKNKDQEINHEEWENLDADNGFDDLEKETIKRRQEVQEKITNYIPELECLIPRSKTASPLIIHNLITICFGASYLLRLYNGELCENHVEVSQKLMKLCPPLSNEFRRYINTTKDAVILGLDQLKVEEGIFKDQETGLKRVLLVYKDLSEIFTYKFYIAEILQEIYECVDTYDRFLSLDHSNQKTKKELSIIKNKVVYYISYLKGFSQDSFDRIKAEIEICSKENEKYIDLYEKMNEIKKESESPFKQ